MDMMEALFATAMEKGSGGGKGGTSIDDSTISTDTTWSSNKINTELNNKVTTVPGKGFKYK